MHRNEKMNQNSASDPPEVTSPAANLMCTNGFFLFLHSQPHRKSSLRLLSVITFHAKPGPDWCLSTPKTYSHQEGMDMWFLSRFCRQFAVFLALSPPTLTPVSCTAWCAVTTNALHTNTEIASRGRRTCTLVVQD